MTAQELLTAIRTGKADAAFQRIYGCDERDVLEHRARYTEVVSQFGGMYGTDCEAVLASAPAAAILGGSRMEPQHGRVLAAALDCDAIACASRAEGEIRISGLLPAEVRVLLDDLAPKSAEQGTPQAFLRALAAELQGMGAPLCGFRAVVDRGRVQGTVVSGQAATEILLCVLMNRFCCEDALRPAQLALLAQRAAGGGELAERLASASGGMCALDFKYEGDPVVQRLGADPARSGYSLCLIDAGEKIPDAGDARAELEAEMAQIARVFGCASLRDLPEDDFWAHLGELRQNFGDGSVLRGVYFYRENQRVESQAEALVVGAFDYYLRLVRDANVSSAALAQDLARRETPREQALAVTVAAARSLLGENAAVRAAGSFAGPVQAYVPTDRKKDFQETLDGLLRPGCCRFVNIRPLGGTVIPTDA